jgi:hypothetical protein
MASAADRRRAQRRLAREIRTETYKRSSIGRRARQVAAELRDREKGEGGGGRDYRSELRDAVKARKRSLWWDRKLFRLHAEMIDDSDEFDAMQEFLDMTEDEAEEKIQAAYAAMKRRDLGQEYDEYDLAFAFLFYH